MTSIRFQAAVLLALAMIIPVIIAGTVGILYYQDVVKHNIWNDNLAEARSVSALTSNYIDLGTTYLRSVADRPLVIDAVKNNNTIFLDANTRYVSDTEQFDDVYVTDRSGRILSYYPHTQLVGSNYLDRPYVGSVLNTSSFYVSDGVRGDLNGPPTVYIGVPIIDNGTTIGVLVGGLDLGNYSRIVMGTQVMGSQYISLINRTGHVMLHSNASYMNSMTNLTSFSVVPSVMEGNEGVAEALFPPENNVRLVAYSPIKEYGWGVLVSVPISVAYKPISDSTWWLIGLIILLLIASIIISYIAGGYIVNPLIRMSDATKEIPVGDTQKFARLVPLKRRDEIGNLARSFLDMSNTIKADRENLVLAKNDAESSRAHAEEEKNRAELYVDIMGHDINNLNQATLNYLELLQNDKNLTDEQRRSMIDQALTSVLGSASIIDNVRKIQQITGEELHLEKVDIDAMLSACAKEAPRPAGKNVIINYAKQKGQFVKGIPLLKEVFCNLIDNSVKFSGAEVTIDINVDEVFQNGIQFFHISISDNGPGIPDDLKQRIFNRLQRGTTKAHGKGLGLYIVKALVERFGGSVSVEDRIPGDHTKGSKFIVTLPAYKGD